MGISAKMAADIPWSWCNLLFLISNLIFFILEAVIVSPMRLLAWLPFLAYWACSGISVLASKS